MRWGPGGLSAMRVGSVRWWERVGEGLSVVGVEFVMWSDGEGGAG